MTSPETSMVILASEYLALRRGLGFGLRIQGRMLLDFARYADESGHRGAITLELATGWARCSRAGAAYIDQRLSIVRQFARHRAAFDPTTQVPPPGLLGGFPRRRKPPHIYSEREITELLRAAQALRPRGGLRPKTYVTLFSLLVATGLRISEACRLTGDDVDLHAGLLVIRESKFRKSRLVPLHPTTVQALRRYAALRDRYGKPARSECFFRTDHAASLRTRVADRTFSGLRSRLGWTAHGRTRMPRIHDLRHTFAVRRLLRWYEEGADVDQKLPALATYLGHANVADTYWYLSAIPELLALTSQLFEHFAQPEAREPR